MGNKNTPAVEQGPEQFLSCVGDSVVCITKGGIALLVR